MSKTDQFWQYDDEAVLSACYAKTDDDGQGLLELARTWTQAALLERASLVGRVAHQVFLVLREQFVGRSLCRASGHGMSFDPIMRRARTWGFQ